MAAISLTIHMAQTSGRGNCSRQMLREIAAGDDAELGRERLEQHGDQIRHQHDPKQAVAIFRAGLNIGREIARVHIGDRDDDGGSDHREDGAKAAAAAVEHFANGGLRAVEPAARCDAVQHPFVLSRAASGAARLADDQNVASTTK